MKLPFFMYYLFSCRDNNFSWRKVTKFWLGDELPDEIFPDKVIVFPKSVATPSKNTHCYQFLCRCLKAFPLKTFSRISLIWLSLVKLHSLEILKIIEIRTLIYLIGENSFLQMHHNKMSFLTF